MRYVWAGEGGHGMHSMHSVHSVHVLFVLYVSCLYYMYPVCTSSHTINTPTPSHPTPPRPTLPQGFREQTRSWPQQPVDVAIAWLKGKPASWHVADFGCGDAKLAASVAQHVHSFDLVAANERVVACNMAHVPLGMLCVWVF